jgi:rhodanese-related sulfurtransferase
VYGSKYEMNLLSYFILGMMLVVLLWSPPSVAAEQSPSTDKGYEDITVDMAYCMIEDLSSSDLVVLDVRSPYEYTLSHLYNAISMPYDELGERIGELQGYKDYTVIVYCSSGSRSTEASEILAEYGFEKVFNMLGGLLAWIDADYGFYSVSHYATVNIEDGEVQVHLEPIVPYTSNCPCCIQSPPTDAAPAEGVISTTLLWSFEEHKQDINRTASLIFTEFTGEDTSFEFYQLLYLVRSGNYSLAISSMLIPSDSETYSIAFTSIVFVPVGEGDLASLEFVEFNSSATLSQQYAAFGKVADEIGKVYKRSGDEELALIGNRYEVVKKESKCLSKLVKTQIQEYDRSIETIRGTIYDGFWECFICGLGCDLAVLGGCAAACFAFPPFCIVCAIVLGYVQLLGILCSEACNLAGCGGWIWF